MDMTAALRPNTFVAAGAGWGEGRDMTILGRVCIGALALSVASLSGTASAKVGVLTDDALSKTVLPQGTYANASSALGIVPGDSGPQDRSTFASEVEGL